ncbi:hypothetical protein RhiirB3_461361, partial [Rhizophagus irregularis]
MVIDDDCYDDNQEHHDNRDNSDEKTESSTATESESYESLYDSFDDNNTFEVLQKGLYSSDNESSDDGINLTEGSNIVGSNINSINDEVARGLRLLEVKTRRNITDAAFKEIVTAAS